FGATGEPMASELSGRPSGSAAIVVPASRSHRIDHQPFGLECRTSGGRVLRPATDRARVSRPQRRRMVRLGADVSLDRQQDPDSRLLLYARNLAAAVSSSRVPECVAGAERRAVSGGPPPDSTCRPPLPAARRQGTLSCGHSAIQADPRSTSSRRIAWTGTALPWVIRRCSSKPHETRVLTGVFTCFRVNSR